MGATSTVSKHSLQDLALSLARFQAFVLGVVLGVAILKPFAKFWYGIALALALNLLFLWVEHKGRRAAIRRDDSRNSAIDALYKELHQLMSRQEPGLEGEIARKLARLRSLQREEAAAMRLRFEASLHLKPGEGWQALSEARKLLSEKENCPSATYFWAADLSRMFSLEDQPIGALEVQEMSRVSGLEPDELSRGLIEAREE